jgi:peptidoglycan/xylan/chitin deacetylase (PgdA/CDA1 family)
MSVVEAQPTAAATAPQRPDHGQSIRIAVFTGKLSDSVQRGILDVAHVVPQAAWLIVLHTPPRAIGRLVRNQVRNLRRNGWRWIPYQAAETARGLIAGLRSRLGRAKPAGRGQWQTFLARSDVSLIEVEDINAPTTGQRVREFGAELGLSLAAPILRPTVFDAPRRGTLNLHKGRVPHYRGMPPAFWELWNAEPSVGCTVHWVDEKLDTGDIAAQGEIPCGKYSTLRGLQLQLDDLGVALMTRAVLDISAGHSVRMPQPTGGRTYRKPTLSQVSALERRLMARQPATQPRVLRLSRDSVAIAARQLRYTGLWRVMLPRITVILYHRVSDDARDNLTVGIAQFDRQMSLLRQHCEVLPLREVLECRAIPSSKRPLVAVTFDDGYLDNRTHAVPVLVRHGLPAAFFVSTGMIGQDRPFPHDVRRGNPTIATMTWPQLREMRDLGFMIGSHSVSHIDCGQEDERVVVDELAQSRDDLERELGIVDPVFAYPYGGRQHMTAQRLELVKAAGYTGCLSAYGGSNVGTVDRFNVLRLGIHWEFTDQAFLFACLGLR